MDPLKQFAFDVCQLLKDPDIDALRAEDPEFDMTLIYMIMQIIATIMEQKQLPPERAAKVANNPRFIQKLCLLGRCKRTFGPSLGRKVAVAVRAKGEGLTETEVAAMQAVAPTYLAG